MSGQLSVFDPKAIADAIKGQIKSAVAASIPDEQWSAMVEAEVTRFIQVDLPGLIKEEIKAEMKERLNLEIRKPEYLGSWEWRAGNNVQTPGEAVKAILTELAPEMLKVMFGAVVQDAVNAMRNQMQRGY